MSKPRPKMSRERLLRKRMITQYRKGNAAAASHTAQELLSSYDKYENSIRSTPAYADDLFNAAMIYAAAGDDDQAMNLYKESIHRVMLHQGLSLEVAARLTNLGVLLIDIGNPDAACNVFEQVLFVSRMFLPSGHKDLAQVLSNLGNALYET